MRVPGGTAGTAAAAAAASAGGMQPRWELLDEDPGGVLNWEDSGDGSDVGGGVSKECDGMMVASTGDAAITKAVGDGVAWAEELGVTGCCIKTDGSAELGGVTNSAGCDNSRWSERQGERLEQSKCILDAAQGKGSFTVSTTT